jgi:ABC-type transport system involved in cytochrome c biogenesis permease subunit
MKNRKHFLESLHFFLIGFLITTEGIEELHSHVIIGGLMLLFGITLLLYFIYVQIKKTQGFNLKIMAHFFEAIVLLFTSYILFKEEKIYVPYFNLAASIGLFISIAVLFYRRKKNFQVNKIQVD